MRVSSDNDLWHENQTLSTPTANQSKIAGVKQCNTHSNNLCTLTKYKVQLSLRVRKFFFFFYDNVFKNRIVIRSGTVRLGSKERDGERLKGRDFGLIHQKKIDK